MLDEGLHLWLDEWKLFSIGDDERVYASVGGGLKWMSSYNVIGWFNNGWRRDGDVDEIYDVSLTPPDAKTSSKRTQ